MMVPDLRKCQIRIPREILGQIVILLLFWLKNKKKSFSGHVTH